MYKQLLIKALLLSFLGVGFFLTYKTITTPDSVSVDNQSSDAITLSSSFIPQIDILDSPRADLSVPELQGTSDNVLRMNLRATAYNSLTAQTDSTPFITATGAKTRFGIVAVSRDMLIEDLPYGSLVKLKDLGHYKTGREAGKYDDLLAKETFIVEDTMHPRKRKQMDVWFPTYNEAKTWGVRQLEIEVVRYGRTGPMLDGTRIVKDKSSGFSPLLSSR